MEIRTDDLSGEALQALLRLHLAGMHASSPFVDGPALADYEPRAFNQFLHLALD